MRFQDRPISAEQRAEQLEQRTLSDPKLKLLLEHNLQRTMAAWPPPRWDFEMLTLAAFFFHPELEVARAESNQASAQIITAGARPNPTIAVTPEYDFTPPAGLSPWLPAVQFDFPIETAGKRGHRIAKAQQLAQVARLNIAATAWRIRSNTRSNLLAMSRAVQRETLFARQLEVQEQAVRRLQQRLEAGAVSRAEISPAIVLRERARLDLNQARSLVTESRIAIAESLGLPAQSLAGITFDLNSVVPAADRLPFLTSAEARRRALTGRTDILMALAEHAAAQAALQVEVARQYPDVHLGTGYQWDQGDNKWSIGLGTEIPLLNRNRGPVAEAEAHRALTAAQFTAVQARILGEIDRALSEYRAAQDQLTNASAVLKSQQDQEQAVRAQVQAGAAENLDLLAVQFELAAAELTTIEASAKVQQALGALEDTLQQPLPFLSSQELNAALEPSPTRVPSR